MSLYLDKTFINRISPMLERFAWKKATLANCRCPVCGDSKTKRSKARGYFFAQGNSFLYKCHNCSHTSNLYGLILRLAPEIAKEYKTQSWIETNGGMSSSEQTQPEIAERIKESIPVFETEPIDLKCIVELSKTHSARKYIESRGIPEEKWDKIFYTTDFGAVARSIDPSCEIKQKQKRIVLPFYDEEGTMIGVCGRAMPSDDSQRKYINIKSKAYSDRIWYNLWDIDPSKTVYVVEGPIDSLFLDNCVAMNGMASDLEIPEKIKNSKLVFILDNESRSEQVCHHIEHLIQNDQLVCIWPEHLECKDINEMVNAYGRDWVVSTINRNTFGGIEALFKLNNWRKF